MCQQEAMIFNEETLKNNIIQKDILEYFKNKVTNENHLKKFFAVALGDFFLKMVFSETKIKN